MTPSFSVGFMGFGTMAEAICKQALDSQILTPQSTYFCETNTERTRFIQDTYHLTSLSMANLIERSQIVLICVKPQSIHSLLSEISELSKNNLFSFKDTCFVSILAGTPIKTFESYLGSSIHCIRLMPNMPLQLGYGMTGVSVNTHVSQSFIDFVISLFRSCGTVQIVPESFMDIVTAISGSGPAFFYRIADAFAQQAETLGMDYDLALRFISQTLIGTGHMLQKNELSCKELIKTVKSPGGTTSSGLDIFDITKLDDHLKQVINASVLRAKELAKG